VFDQFRLSNLHKIGSKVGLNMGLRVAVSLLDRRKQMWVICIKSSTKLTRIIEGVLEEDDLCFLA